MNQNKQIETARIILDPVCLPVMQEIYVPIDLAYFDRIEQEWILVTTRSQSDQKRNNFSPG